MILSSLTSQFNPRHKLFSISPTVTTAIRYSNFSAAAASFRQVSISSNGNGNGEDDVVMVSSASAIAAAIRKASTSPVEFEHKIEVVDGKSKGIALPSSDFQTLCVEQLDLFRRIVDPQAVLSVYVRPAGSYVMDRLELRRVTIYPGRNVTDILILIGNFSIPTGLRLAEASLLKQQDRC